MKCLITNSCKYKNLCCGKCRRTACEDRCKDNFEKCKYFENTKVEIREHKEKGE